MTTQHMAGLKELVVLAALRDSGEPFLTAYLNTENENLPADIQARFVDLLWEAQERYAESRWAGEAQRERQRVLPIVPEIEPVGPGLVVISSEAAGVLEVRPLPGAVEDGVRVGLGVHAMPLLDLIDENEPVGVAFVENDEARLLAVSAGRVIGAQHFGADVPSRENAEGWHAAVYDPHRREQARKHFHGVAEALSTFQKTYGFDRLLVGGPTEPLTAFKIELSSELARIVVGEMGIDTHASDAQIAAQVSPLAERMERDAELRIVRDLVVAVEKRQGAVAGVDATLAALHNHELHSLVVDPDAPLGGLLCPACDRLLAGSTLRCPECTGALESIDLREELPRHLPSRHIVLEMVHGEAAAELWGHGSIGGLLKIRPH